MAFYRKKSSPNSVFKLRVTRESDTEGAYVPSWCQFWPASPSLVPACGRSAPRGTGVWRSTGSGSAPQQDTPWGGTRRATCGWCTRSPGRRGSRPWVCSCSAVSQTGLQWRSAPSPRAGSPSMHTRDMSSWELQVTPTGTSILHTLAYELMGCSDLVTARGRRTQVQAQLYFWVYYFKRQKVRGKSSGRCRFPTSITWCSVYSVTLEGWEAAKRPPPIITKPTSSSGGQPSALAWHTSSL